MTVPHSVRIGALVVATTAFYTYVGQMVPQKEVLPPQETVLAAVRSVSAFRGESSLQTWLFRIAANACRKMRRRGKAEPERELSLEEFLPGAPETILATHPGGEETPDVALDRADLREALDAGIADLPPGYRAVLILRDLEGLSTEEAAQVLGIEPGAVRTRLHRARLSLRQRLTAHRM